MIVPCPNCKRQVTLNSEPSRGPIIDGSECWLCLKCPATVCVMCYLDHTSEKHRDWMEGKEKKKKKLGRFRTLASQTASNSVEHSIMF